MFICVYLWFQYSLCSPVAKLKMELEFDKEIDAILRKARDSGVAAMTAASPHLDADVIAAFAENALPDKAKLLHMEHFADCGRCRRLLSQSILMNSEAVAANEGTASSVVSAPVAEVSAPWYKTLFKTQNLALAMGALVLVFGGVLGIIVLQNRNGSAPVDVSQLNEPQPRIEGQSASGDITTLNSNTASNTMPAANAAAAAANAPAMNSSNAPASPVGNVAPGTIGRLDSAESKERQEESNDKTSSADSVTSTSGAGLSAGKPSAAPVPLPTGGGQPVIRDEKKLEPEKSKDADTMLLDGSRAAETRMMREAPPSAKKDGPSRSGPLQNQTQTQLNKNAGEMIVIRSVGGKKFQNRDGAWYDTAYHGQSTNNFRRSTDDYKKLDGGLRKIADTLGGTVVVVWKEKAYRIQ